METHNFKIFYHDRPPYIGDPYKAPIFGVLLVLEKDEETGRRIVQNGDYYVWDGKRWWPVDYPGLLDYLQIDGPKRILIGRLVSNEDFTRVYREAENDLDFPIRTAYGRSRSRVR